MLFNLVQSKEYMSPHSFKVFDNDYSSRRIAVLIQPPPVQMEVQDSSVLQRRYAQLLIGHWDHHRSVKEWCLFGRWDGRRHCKGGRT
ncbi:uncharacterized protein K460DRAFT_370787 [Cucurbitaria berberidis CBS 394.84]|uniref:Uncharacterized protein n=1 Tax=Cucurbitaria berberidis CBS 394.84 TaxID=1168544 RepID=A0A9P4G839_9PLEO|nr:uncharacterized protein K460DRAFT_370787 [Cucurbitaria berberidis CBS 394.84]KAF1840808.1 hypothetical protein K460DRAFT_370787 [Cucurbitaria berberidis CBS 394.84]